MRHYSALYGGVYYVTRHCMFNGLDVDPVWRVHLGSLLWMGNTRI